MEKETYESDEEPQTYEPWFLYCILAIGILNIVLCASWLAWKANGKKPLAILGS